MINLHRAWLGHQVKSIELRRNVTLFDALFSAVITFLHIYTYSAPKSSETQHRAVLSSMLSAPLFDADAGCCTVGITPEESGE
jgi:hypothetical protein